jgi:hypothetical protein
MLKILPTRGLFLLGPQTPANFEQPETELELASMKKMFQYLVSRIRWNTKGVLLACKKNFYSMHCMHKTEILYTKS